MDGKPLFGRLNSSRFDIEKLRRNYNENILKYPSVEYQDNKANYVGWAVTSDDGDIHNGVKQQKQNTIKNSIKTPLCNGYLEYLIDQLEEKKLGLFRCRILKLVDGEMVMKFHKDASIPYYRLHIPIYTNETCKFQWRYNGAIHSAHMPADGSVYFVRVDVDHRAINATDVERVHFVCGTKEAGHKVLFNESAILDDRLEVSHLSEA